MKKEDDWPTAKEQEDLTYFAYALEDNHKGHDFDMAFLEHRGIHYAVSRCNECKQIMGIAPVPEAQYFLYETAYKALVKLDKNEKGRSKKPRGHQPTFHTLRKRRN